MSSISIDVPYVIRYISDNIGVYNKPESLKKWCEEAMKEFSPKSLELMRISVHNNLNRIENLEGFSINEKLQLAFIFSRPVSDGFVQQLIDAKFEIKQDSKKRISRFSTEDGTVVRFSDHNKDVKYFRGVLCQNTRWKRYMYKERTARERKQGQQDMENENAGSEMMEGQEPMEEMQEEMELMVEEEEGIADISLEEEPTQEVHEEETEKFQQDIDYEYTSLETKEEQMEPENRESDEEDEKESIEDSSIQPLEPSSNFATPNEPQIGYSEKTPNTPSNTYVLSSNLVPNTSVISKIDKAIQTSSTSSNYSASEATSTSTTQYERNISVLSLVTHIKSMASFYNLESIQKKASLAVEKLKRMKELGNNKTLPVEKFNFLIGSFVVCLEENTVLKNKTSISLNSVLKHLHQFFIRPLGSQIVHEAIELVAQKIIEYENRDDAYDGIPLTLLSESLHYLLISIGFYNKLE